MFRVYVPISKPYFVTSIPFKIVDVLTRSLGLVGGVQLVATKARGYRGDQVIFVLMALMSMISLLVTHHFKVQQA